jgi:hypothetical protein
MPVLVQEARRPQSLGILFADAPFLAPLTAFGFAAGFVLARAFVFVARSIAPMTAISFATIFSLVFALAFFLLALAAAPMTAVGFATVLVLVFASFFGLQAAMPTHFGPPGFVSHHT